jgi:tetratricopeptide (TPR) repeat protein
VGAYAAERGRWDVHARIIDSQRDRSQAALTQGDSIAARVLETVASAVEGYGLIRRGEPEEAIAKLEAVQGYKFGPDHWVRWWLGEAHVAAGQPEQAVRYFRTLWLNRFKFYGSYRLGELYTELGEHEKAREAYQSFLRMWKDADADLPQLARAEAALRAGADR